GHADRGRGDDRGARRPPAGAGDRGLTARRGHALPGRHYRSARAPRVRPEPRPVGRSPRGGRLVRGALRTGRGVSRLNRDRAYEQSDESGGGIATPDSSLSDLGCRYRDQITKSRAWYGPSYQSSREKRNWTLVAPVGTGCQ